MKKLLYILGAVLVGTAVAGCVAKEGTDPGNDSAPAVTIYSYTPGADYNPDNDIQLRFMANSKAEAVYYLAEPAETKEAYVKASGEPAYFDYVVSNGTKLGSSPDVVLEGLKGDYRITAVAVAGNEKTGAEVAFTGLDWTDVVSGNYYYQSGIAGLFGAASVPSTLQKANKEGLYRLTNVYGEGLHLKLELNGDSDEDADGKYFNFTVAQTPTGRTYGIYGDVFVRCVATGQGNATYAAYNCLYEDGYVNLYVEYYVTADRLYYGNDVFVPDTAE